MSERNARVVRPNGERVDWSKARKGNTRWKAEREVNGVVAGVIGKRQVGRNERNGQSIWEANRGKDKRAFESLIYEWTIAD